MHTVERLAGIRFAFVKYQFESLYHSPIQPMDSDSQIKTQEEIQCRDFSLRDKFIRANIVTY